MMRNKFIAKIAAAVLVGSSLVTSVLPVYAAGSTSAENITKNESVYTVLNANGSVSEITVSDILHSDNGFDHYADTSDLTDVENLKSDKAVKQTGTGYSWSTKSKDIYYQGQAIKDLPLDVKITYTLDGKKMSAKKMLGKSGHVKIKIAITNKETQDYSVDGKTYTLGTPFITVAGAMLDQDKFSNVKINEGTVQTDSSHNIAAAVMIPGLRDGLKDVLDADAFSTLDSYLIDDVTIEADVKKYASPSIMLAAATDMDSLKDDLNDMSQNYNLSEIFDDLNKLQDATDALVSGSQTLYSGADALNNGIGTLNNGVSSLQSGVSQLGNGADVLNNGANQLSQGASSLQSGLEQLSSNSAALNAGAQQIANGILTTANQTLKSNDATKNLPDLTMSNYTDVLGGISGASDTRNATLTEVAKQAGQSTDITRDLIYMAATANPNTAWTADSLASAMTTQGSRLQAADEVNKTVGNVNSKEDALKNGNVQALLTGVKQQALENVPAATDEQMNQIKAAIAAQSGISILDVKDEQAEAVYKQKYRAGVENTDFYDQIASQVRASNPNLDDGTIAKLITYTAVHYDTNTPLATQLGTAGAKLTDAATVAVAMQNAASSDGTVVINGVLDSLFKASDANQQIQQLETSLTGVKTFTEGLKTYTTGVDAAYAGSKSLSAGAAQVASGAAQLKKGTKQLESGANELKSGTNNLADGSSQLKGGVKELMDGLKQFNDEGISKITKSDKVTELKDATDLLEALKNDGKSYNNYSGISEGTKGSVKFIYKVEGVKAKTVKNASDNDKKDTRSFWQRLIDLFKFNK